MNILICPMTAMAQTAGSFKRAILLAKELNETSFNLAVCCGKDMNYKKIDNTKEYGLSVPSPLGLPKAISKRTFPIAQKLGISSKKEVKSFEDVLFLTGNSDYKYLKKSIAEIRFAIKDFGADAVYSEFNISAIIAAKVENVKLFISSSFPTLPSYACTKKHKKGVNKVLSELNMKNVDSLLDLFSWADMKFIHSCHELEPLDTKNTVFTGSLKQEENNKSDKRDKILVYMGNGTISAKKTKKEILSAFINSEYQIFIASSDLKEENINNIHIAPFFNFNDLLPESVLFINHGGQNSVIDGLINAVPQIICPGKVFERKFNASSVEKIGAGIVIREDKFDSENIKNLAEKIINSPEYSKNAQNIGDKLLSLGGAKKIAEVIKSSMC